jgi:hypothetical protein
VEDPEKTKLFSKLETFYTEYHLSDFQKFAAGKFIKDNISNPQNQKVDRIRDWLMFKLNHKRPAGFDRQKGCPDLIPKLRAKPFWGREDFPWLKVFEDNFEQIKEEVIALRSAKGFQPYRGPSWISNIKAEDGSPH